MKRISVTFELIGCEELTESQAAEMIRDIIELTMRRHGGEEGLHEGREINIVSNSRFHTRP